MYKSREKERLIFSSTNRKKRNVKFTLFIISNLNGFIINNLFYAKFFAMIFPKDMRCYSYAQYQIGIFLPNVFLQYGYIRTVRSLIPFFSAYSLTDTNSIIGKFFM